METEKHLISEQASIYDALVQMDQLGDKMILFVVDSDQKLVGTLTDGDLRRALVRKCPMTEQVEEVMRKDYRFIFESGYDIAQLAGIRQAGVRFLPMLDASKVIVKVIDLKEKRSLLPIHAIIMAGGEGRRLRPQTEKVPKPLLKVGGKPIIQYNMEHLARYGVGRMTLSIRYLGEQIQAAFGDGQQFGWNVDYVEETDSLGTMGALALMKGFSRDTLLVMNSDLLTNIDFEHFFLEFTQQSAAMAVATVPYRVAIPYGIMETEENRITQFQEKPEHLYYANAGIYLLRSSLASLIPRSGAFNATDMIETLIAKGEKVISYPLRGYWLDIGRPGDFVKAQDDIRYIRF